MLVLSNFVEKVLEKIEKTEVSIESWLISLFSIVFLRTFLEQFSNKVLHKFPLVDFPTLFHYFSFYLSAVLVCILILTLISGLNFKKSAILSLFFSLIITTPPIFDLFASFGQGFNMAYIFSNAKDLFLSFLTFFYKGDNSGITFGIRLELFVLFISMFLFNFVYTKKIWKAILSSVLVYASIFILLSIPSIPYIFSMENPSISIVKDVMSSKIVLNNLNPNYTASIEALFDIGFNKLLGQIFTIISLFVFILISIKNYKNIFIEVFKNFRIERVFHYSFLILFGFFFSISNSGSSFLGNYINIISLVSLILSFSMSWITAVCINDLEDIEIDKISNKERPLVTGSLGSDDLKNIFKISFIFSILLAYFISGYSLFFVVLFSGLYYIYSAKSLKLKRFFPVNSMLIGLACLSAFYAGFLLSADYRYITDLPLSFAVSIFIFFTLGSFIKDLKDIEGDKKEGIKTMALILGEKRAKLTFSLFFVISFFIVSFLLKSPFLVFLSILLSFPAYKSINRENFKESWFFIIYLTFFFFVILRFAI